MPKTNRLTFLRREFIPVSESTRPQDLIHQTIEGQQGLLRARPAIVERNSYSGTGLFADDHSAVPLDDMATADPRPGYRPVEWWIMSCVTAENQIPRPGEGLTHLTLLDGSSVSLNKAFSALAPAHIGTHGKAEDFGESWPLIKILDIGGDPVETDFGSHERPPIPPHIHSGNIQDGKLIGPGKREAYFFLPNKEASGEAPAITRIDLRPGITESQLVAAVKTFGSADAVYPLLNAYEARPFEGWSVPPRILHAPGAITTVEMQTPQDDFNLLGWKLGKRLDREEKRQEWDDSVVRGLASAEELVAQGVAFRESDGSSLDPPVHHPAKVESPEPGIQRRQAFTPPFQGDYFAIDRGVHFRIEASDTPRAIAIWAGSGQANGISISSRDWNQRELFLAPGYPLDLRADGEGNVLEVLIFGPIVGPA